MADKERTEGADTRLESDGDGGLHTAEKRRSTDDTSRDAAPQKKISISIGSKPAIVNQKISFNLGGSTTSQAKFTFPLTDKKLVKPTPAPIKISLGGTLKVNEPPPVVQKRSLAAKVFDDSDESEDEMPPEAKMRMKNIGRDTPTASGPNSYGKGKQGFVDRFKIVEKKLKEDQDKVSGDNKDTVTD